MQASTRVIGAAAIAAFAALGTTMSFAQAAQDERAVNGTEPVGQTTSPSMMNSTVRSEDVQREAIAAAHAGGNSEAVGQSTAAPMMNSNVSSDEVYKGAVAASHPTATEPEGQSTSPRRVGSGG
jgi:hypothetical protein